MNAWILFTKSATLRNEPRLIARWLSTPNHRSTWFNQDADVGVKCRWERGPRGQPPGPGPTGSEFVVQTLDAGGAEAPLPLADGLRCDADALGDGRVVHAVGAGENHAGSRVQGVRQGGRPGDPVELVPLLVRERERCEWASEWHWQAPLLEDRP